MERPVRVFEILALAPSLRREAEGRCVSVNEAHMIVHKIVAAAFMANPDLVPSNNLRGHLSSQLKRKLAASPC
jgi:hypothetical protein